jgi:ATP-dependent RNA helicase DeaD
MNRGALKLDELETVVLDEADEMLDMGFVEDIETLLDETPDTRQAVLFSATMPRRIETLAQKYLREPVTVRIQREEVPDGEAPKVRQTAYLVPRSHTTAALGRVLEAERPRAAIVFCRTRLDVDAVTETLTARGLRAEALHGGMDQEHRTRVVDRLRSGRTELLVATDVAARGPGHRPAHARGQPRRAAVVRGVRAPHRARRAGRARGRRDHARAAVEDVRAAQRGEAHRAADRDRARADGRRPARRPARAHPDRAGGGRRRGLGRSRDVEDVRAMLAGLAAEHDLLDVATAAVRLMQSAAGAPDDGEDIPVVTAGRTRGERSERPVKGRGAGPRPAEVGHDPALRQRRARGRRAAAGHRGRARQRVEPLGRDIGAIQIHERHALVEVPEHAADDVLRSLRGSTTLKGRRANVRRDRDFAGAGRGRS